MAATTDLKGRSSRVVRFRPAERELEAASKTVPLHLPNLLRLPYLPPPLFDLLVLLEILAGVIRAEEEFLRRLEVLDEAVEVGMREVWETVELR